MDSTTPRWRRLASPDQLVEMRDAKGDPGMLAQRPPCKRLGLDASMLAVKFPKDAEAA